jgi:hypothetical protein
VTEKLSPSIENKARSCGPSGTRTQGEKLLEALENKPIGGGHIEVKSPRLDAVRRPSAPLDDSRGAILERAIDRLTFALTTAPDEVIADLVSERRAMRGELDALRRQTACANVVPIRRD